MRALLFQFNDNGWIKHPSNDSSDDQNPQLVLCFGGKKILQQKNIYELTRQRFAGAEIIMCSTAGEIYQDAVQEDTLIASALYFSKTTIRTAAVNIEDHSNSYEAALELLGKLPSKDLKYLMVFSDGRLVNGSELVKGLKIATGPKVLVTGGLAGDNANFESTLTGLNEQPIPGRIVVAGFYGNAITITHGSQGGWDIFGLEKKITRSERNVLFEIENQNALQLYKKYLGSEAENLPASALSFPLYVTMPDSERPVVRTILSIDAEKQTMTFAGDVPEGSKIRFMKANFERLTDAASIAAAQSLIYQRRNPAFALLVSCVGRKLLLGNNTIEEVKAVDRTFSNQTTMAGFYSYGEISPFNDSNDCQLHNQTMTITAFFESV